MIAHRDADERAVRRLWPSGQSRGGQGAACLKHDGATLHLGISGIHHKVQNGTIDLGGVNRHHGVRCAGVKDQRQLITQHPLKHRPSSGDVFIDRHRQRSHLRPVPTRQRQKPLVKAGSHFGGIGGIAQELVQFGVCRAQLSQFDIGQDYGKDVVEIMRHHAGHAAHGLLPLGARQGRLHAPVLGVIDQHAEHPFRLPREALAREAHMRLQLHLPLLAIHKRTHFEREPPLTFWRHRALPMLPIGVWIKRAQEIKPVLGRGRQVIPRQV